MPCTGALTFPHPSLPPAKAALVASGATGDRESPEEGQRWAPVLGQQTEVSAFQGEEHLPLPWSAVTSSDTHTYLLHSILSTGYPSLAPYLGKALHLAQDLIADNKASFCSENCCLSHAPQPLGSCFHRKPKPSPPAMPGGTQGVQQPSLWGWGSAPLRGPPHPFCYREQPWY